MYGQRKNTMSQWEILPFQGLGELRFGMSKASVHAILGDNCTAVDKYRSPNLREAYTDLGIHVDYDEHDQVEFIETTRRCNPTYNGVEFFALELQAVLEQLSDLGISYEEDVDGYDFTEQGFVLYVPVSSIEAVAVYRRGYYDALRGG